MANIPDSELHIAFTAIDQEMRAENINIPARPLMAMSKLSQRYHLEIDLRSELAERMNKWFEDLYGERLKVGWLLGSTAILIAGDVYKITIPLFFGTHGFVFDAGPEKRKAILSGREVIISNIKKYVQGLTEARINTMTINECNDVVTKYGKAAIAWSSLGSVAYADFVVEARADLNASVEHLFSRLPHFGLSRWASLQAVEKLLKAYIQEQGGRFQWTHKLDDLAAEGERLGLSRIDRIGLASIQCSPGVRYGSEQSTAQQAVTAHAAATEISGTIAAHFTQRTEWKILLVEGQSKDQLRKMILLMRGTPADFARAGIGPEHLKN
jgi:HEPN domain-containing protein